MSKVKKIHCLVAGNAPRVVAFVRMTQERSVASWIDTQAMCLVRRIEWNARVRPQDSDIAPDGSHAFFAFLQGSYLREAEVWAWGESEPRLSWRHSYGTPTAGRFLGDSKLALTVNCERHSKSWPGAPESLRLNDPIGANKLGNSLWPVVDPAPFERTDLEYVVERDPDWRDAALVRQGWSPTGSNMWRKAHATSGNAIVRSWYRRYSDNEREEFSWDGPSRLSPTGTTYLDFDHAGRLVVCGHGFLRLYGFTGDHWRLAGEWQLGRV